VLRFTAPQEIGCWEKSFRRGLNIDEDGWGICQRLELWFQVIEEERIVLHIQKPFRSHDRKYVEDLQNFFKRLKDLEYVEHLKEIGY
jgi:hypothetical protein